ncbi:hypothetical protein C8R45DRAFT_1082693 [Mycena sanguinolenta]|nr:hypothetical protein C8R45DRAFT_1082693 [Mycena sanguinolenta]
MQLNKFLAGAHGPLRQATAGPIQIANIRGLSARARGALFRDLGDTSNAVFKSCGMFAVALIHELRYLKLAVTLSSLERRQWAVSVLICNLQSISNSNKTGELTVDTTISSGVTSQYLQFTGCAAGKRPQPSQQNVPWSELLNERQKTKKTTALTPSGCRIVELKTAGAIGDSSTVGNNTGTARTNGNSLQCALDNMGRGNIDEVSIHSSDQVGRYTSNYAKSFSLPERPVRGIFDTPSGLMSPNLIFRKPRQAIALTTAKAGTESMLWMTGLRRNAARRVIFAATATLGRAYTRNVDISLPPKKTRRPAMGEFATTGNNCGGFDIVGYGCGDAVRRGSYMCCANPNGAVMPAPRTASQSTKNTAWAILLWCRTAVTRNKNSSAVVVCVKTTQMPKATDKASQFLTGATVVIEMFVEFCGKVKE